MPNYLPFTTTCRDPLPPDPCIELAVAPRPWLSRLPGECAFPVDGESWLTRSCCNPSGEESYCEAHERLMRLPPECLV
jgi:hypothetical protein